MKHIKLFEDFQAVSAQDAAKSAAEDEKLIADNKVEDIASKYFGDKNEAEAEKFLQDLKKKYGEDANAYPRWFRKLIQRRISAGFFSINANFSSITWSSFSACIQSGTW